MKTITLTDKQVTQIDYALVVARLQTQGLVDTETDMLDGLREDDLNTDALKKSLESDMDLINAIQEIRQLLLDARWYGAESEGEGAPLESQPERRLTSERETW